MPWTGVADAGGCADASQQAGPKDCDQDGCYVKSQPDASALAAAAVSKVHRASGAWILANPRNQAWPRRPP